MVQRSMRLIAVSGAQLLEDGMGDLVEAELEDLGVKFLEETVGIDIGLAKIEISL